MVIGDAATYVVAVGVICLFGTLGWLGYLLEQKTTHPQLMLHRMQTWLIVISTTLFLPISYQLGILYSNANPLDVMLGIKNFNNDLFAIVMEIVAGIVTALPFLFLCCCVVGSIYDFDPLSTESFSRAHSRIEIVALLSKVSITLNQTFL